MESRFVIILDIDRVLQSTDVLAAARVATADGAATPLEVVGTPAAGPPQGA